MAGSGDRTPCLIPGCRRTIKAQPPATEWVCGQHWRLVPKRMRDIYLRARRQRRPATALNRLWRAISHEAVAQALTSDFTKW